MNINVTITQDDVEEAIREWFQRKLEFELVKNNNRIDISWRGGSTYMVLVDGKLVTDLDDKEAFK